MFVPYRINGQYILEGMAGGMMYSMGGAAEWDRGARRVYGHGRCAKSPTPWVLVTAEGGSPEPARPPALTRRRPSRVPSGMGLILLDMAHKRDVQAKYRKLLMGM